MSPAMHLIPTPKRVDLVSSHYVAYANTKQYAVFVVMSGTPGPRTGRLHAENRYANIFTVKTDNCLVEDTPQ